MNFEPLRRGAMVCFSIHAQQYSLGWEGSTGDHPLSSVTILWSASGRSRIMKSNHGGIDRTSLQCCYSSSAFSGITGKNFSHWKTRIWTQWKYISFICEYNDENKVENIHISPRKSSVVFRHLQQLVKCACPRVQPGSSLQVCQCICEIHQRGKKVDIKGGD